MGKFRQDFIQYFKDFQEVVSTEENEWTVKGFIDIYKNIYTISVDTKVVSKILELMIFPVIQKFAVENDYQIALASYQNHYPDITFIKDEERIAVDLKSTYRVNKEKVNGMTLGAFTGYFRNRSSTKNITFPYKTYSKHYILGIIYSRSDMAKTLNGLEKLGITPTNGQLKKIETYFVSPSEEQIDEICESMKIEGKEKEQVSTILSEAVIDEKQRYELKDLTNILSVVRDFQFFLQEKWKIATDRPGSGNTKNIGSETAISDLINGTGLFTKLTNGEAVFNDYWMYYLTKDMAQAVGFDEPPYHNIETYFKYKGLRK